MGGPLVGPNAQLFPKMDFEGPPHSLTHSLIKTGDLPFPMFGSPLSIFLVFHPIRFICLCQCKMCQAQHCSKCNLLQSVILCKVLNNGNCLIKQSAPLCRVPISYNFHFAYCCTLLSFALCIVILFAQFCTVHCFLIDLVHLRTDSQSC